MPESSIPNGRSDDRLGKQTFLSPRKSLVAVGIVCALSAAALWVGHAPDNPTQPPANPSMDSHGH